MNAKLLFKTIFLMLIVLLLVMIGLNNRGSVSFSLPPLLPKTTLPAAIMYIVFFAVGVITGTILTSGKGGGGKSSGAAAKPKPSK